MSEKIVKFKAGGYGEKIERVEVERESDSCVWINGRRNNKRSQYESFFDSWEEAKAWLLERAEREVSQCRRNLEYANSQLGNVKGLKKEPSHE